MVSLIPRSFSPSVFAPRPLLCIPPTARRSALRCAPYVLIFFSLLGACPCAFLSGHRRACAAPPPPPPPPFPPSSWLFFCRLWDAPYLFTGFPCCGAASTFPPSFLPASSAFAGSRCPPVSRSQADPRRPRARGGRAGRPGPGKGGCHGGAGPRTLSPLPLALFHANVVFFLRGFGGETFLSFPFFTLHQSLLPFLGPPLLFLALFLPPLLSAPYFQPLLPPSLCLVRRVCGCCVSTRLNCPFPKSQFGLRFHPIHYAFLVPLHPFPSFPPH